MSLNQKNNNPSLLDTEKIVPKTDLGASKPWQAANPDGLQPLGDTVRDENAAQESRADVSETLGGATSSDVYTGLGKPMQGETSSELHHNGQHHRKRQGGGVEQFGVQATAENNISRKDGLLDLKEQSH